MTAFHIAFDAGRDQRRRLEGPTRAETTRARARVADLRRRAADALTAGHDEQAFDLDAAAFDIACEFAPYGIDLHA